MKTLISAADLAPLLDAAAAPRLLDCRFDLADPDAGERAWREGHLPGAIHVHLDRDLSGAKPDAAGPFPGRHPLPQREALAARVGSLGIGPASTVVCYDAQGGPYAARAWWLLRWLGHQDVAVLDGGVAAWQATGGLLSQEHRPPAPLAPYPTQAAAMATVDAQGLLAGLGRLRLVDARAAERFRGEVEPLDAAAGHIPGARNRPFKANLASDGRFKTAEALRAEWAPLLGADDAGACVQYCGSGVTACHNLLALAHAGLGCGVLYPGSWSEWSADAARPQARGG